MSGGRDFDPEKFLGVAHYMLHRDQGTPSDKLAWLMFHADMEGYLRLGHSLTGATYLRGKYHPEVAEAGVGWFQRVIHSLSPWWVHVLGWALTGYVVGKSLR